MDVKNNIEKNLILEYLIFDSRIFAIFLNVIFFQFLLQFEHTVKFVSISQISTNVSSRNRIS